MSRGSELGGYAHLAGSARFQSSTCMGNWAEERELRRTILKDILAKKTQGTLRLDAYHQRMSMALDEVELTRVKDDPYVHFGDVVQLVHLETGQAVAGDVTDRDQRPGEEACAATAAPDVRAPCARNTFVLLKYLPDPGAPLENYYDDDCLRYGQKVRLALNPRAMGEVTTADGGTRPLCLFSKPPSMTYFAKYSRKQLVGLTHRKTYDSVWQVLTPDPTQRVVSEGVEVLAGAPILLVHAATQQPLIVEEGQVYPNEFGNERELSARQSTSHGSKQVLEQTSKGLMKGTIPRAENSLNYFAFITGEKVEELPASSKPDDSVAADTAINAVVGELLSKAGALKLLEKKMVTLSNERSELPSGELLMVLRQCGCSLPEPDIALLTAKFGTHKRAVMDAGAFLQAVRSAAMTSSAS